MLPKQWRQGCGSESFWARTTDLDKSILDALSRTAHASRPQLLLTMVLNQPTERLTAGKPARGTVVSQRLSPGALRVVIEVP